MFHHVREKRAAILVGVWIAIVHIRSFSVWFDWETVRFFVQPRPGRFRVWEPWVGNWIDLSDYGIRVASLTFRPLMSWLFQLEALLFSHHAWGYHLPNFFLHLSCAYGVFLLGRQWRLGLRARIIAMAFFGLHPLATQPLWILGDGAEQVVLLAGIITLLTYRERPRIACVAFAMGLLAKETAVTIPLWIVLDDLIFHGFPTFDFKAVFQRARRYSGFALVLCGYLVYRFLIFSGMGGYHSVQHFSFSMIAEVMSHNLAWLLAIPRPFPGIFILGLALAVIPFIFRWRPGMMAVLWSVVFLLPLVNLCNKWYLYTPLAAISIYIGAAYDAIRAFAPVAKNTAFLIFLGLAVSLGIASAAELRFQQRNAAVPMKLAGQVKYLYPALPKGIEITFRLPRGISPEAFSGHFFRPSRFRVKATKTAAESIVWDLNATRFHHGTPVWTRSVEAALRLVYDDITLHAVLAGGTGAPLKNRPRIVIRYDPDTGICRKD